MVICSAIMDFRSNWNYYPHGYSGEKNLMSAWLSAGSFLIMLLSFFSCFGCVAGIVFNIFQIVKEKDLL